MERPKITRTEWAELQVEELLSVPFVSEFVFRSPKHNDPDEKEVIDHLVIHGGRCILLSQNPDDRPKWCEHPRRGRVKFDSIPSIIHGIALAETWRQVDLSSTPADLPMEYMGIPLTYLSINDFLNLAVQLRTVPELLEYLSARRTLPEASLRRLGDEWTMFEFYLLNGSFTGCTGHDDARQKLEANADVVREALELNAEHRFYSGLLEYVADCLAVRDPDYAQGLSEHLLALFDPDGERKNYILLQEILVDLRLRERAELGRAFHSVTERVSTQGDGLSFQASHIDGKDRVFLFVAARNRSKAEISEAIHTLTGAAMAHFRKGSCLVIVDRDGKHFDLALTRPDYQPTADDEGAGRKYFGHLRMRSVDVSKL